MSYTMIIRDAFVVPKVMLSIMPKLNKLCARGSRTDPHSKRPNQSDFTKAE
jgi:hypothetical protein